MKIGDKITVKCDWIDEKPDGRYEREETMSEMVYVPEGVAKADAGKLQIHMVPMQIVRDCAEVRMYGTAKYGDENNWKKVELIRYIDAMLRHTLAFVEDIHSVDEESGIPHYKHAECNWSFISQLMSEGKCPPKRERKEDEQNGLDSHPGIN